MRQIDRIVRMGAFLALLGNSSLFPLRGQSSSDPATNQTFNDVVSQMSVLRWYNFGTASGSTISNLQQLENSFNPYGIAGDAPFDYEWERYQPFNNTNFVFTANSLDLTATIPPGGGLYNGGIDSGQIWTKETFQPGVTGKSVYAFLIRLKVPNGVGMFSAAWLYSEQNGDGSEIDNPEFMNMKWQNQFDWTGYDHGPGAGSDIYSIKTNQWVWAPGLDFSASYHDYELVWTPDATYKYVDGTLIEAQHFTWTAQGPAQLGINLAVGSSNPNATGLQPTSLSEFPSSVSVQYVGIWAK